MMNGMIKHDKYFKFFFFREQLTLFVLKEILQIEKNNALSLMVSSINTFINNNITSACNVSVSISINGLNIFSFIVA